MARKAYIGVNGKARRVTKMYIGAKMLTNLLPNGDFEGSGWSGATHSTAHAYSGTRSMQCVGTAGSAEDTHNTTANIALNNTHQYYASIYGWQDTKTNGARVGFYWPVAEPSFNDNLPVGEAGQWNRYSATNNRNSFSNSSYPFRVDWNNNGVAGTIYFDGCMLIDLTAEFGAGNEPTKEWCDEHIRFTAGGQVCAFVDGNSKARNIKKAYVGIGGKARPCFDYEGVDYYGEIAALTNGKAYLAATTVGSYALFGGGRSSEVNGEVFNTVDAYNSSLAKSTPSVLSRAAYELAATTVGNYALFGGGNDGGFIHNIVNAYNANLTRTTPIGLSQNSEGLAATTVGNYALFGGGYNGSGVSDVNAYNQYLTRTTPTGLSYARRNLAATTVGNYALFGGGFVSDRGARTGRVDSYSSSLVMTTLSDDINDAPVFPAATTVGNYALFGGGSMSRNINGEPIDAVTSYNTSLVKGTPTKLSVARTALAATTVGNYALFGGGRNGANDTITDYSTVDAYSPSLARFSPKELVANRVGLAATTVGNYAMFGGGFSIGAGYRNTVEAYVYRSKEQ